MPGLNSIVSPSTCTVPVPCTSTDAPDVAVASTSYSPGSTPAGTVTSNVSVCDRPVASGPNERLAGLALQPSGTASDTSPLSEDPPEFHTSTRTGTVDPGHAALDPTSVPSGTASSWLRSSISASVPLASSR